MAKCTHPRCRSLKPGLWEPIVLLWPAKPSAILCEPASVTMLRHRICDECVKISRPLDFIPTLIEWGKICQHFEENKKARPTLHNAKMSFMIPETTKLIRGDVV
jgi:hypothetical protein